MEDRFKFRAGYESFATGKYVLQETDEVNPHEFWNINNKCPFDTPIMQCTGLKDKNGKLIYESDIVKIGGFPVEIKWDEFSNCGCCDIVAGIGFNFHNSIIQDNMEVIGNLYENPELLKENQ